MMTCRALAFLAVALTVAACGSTGGATEGGTVPDRAPAISTTPPPARSDANQNASLSVRITASSYGAISAQTAAGATCTVSSVLPSGGAGTSAGLRETHTADGGGRVSWSYQRGTNTKPGTGTHTVRCTLGGASATASAPFSVP
jgi:hypothetical protein